MNRTIKFRAWELSKKKFTMFFNIPAQLGDEYPMLHQGFRFQQFTGLLDKNGKEIYENDLLKCEDGKVREVVWYELGAGWRVGTDDKDTLFNGLGVYSNKLEVIGNSYES